MRHLDKNSYIPLSKQLEEVISERIILGQYKVTDRIPSQEKFVEEFDISRITVRQCMANLHSKGIIESFKGKGTFIKAVPPKSNVYHSFSGLSAQFKSNKQQLETHVISKKIIESPKEISNIFHIENASKIYAIQRVRKIDHVSFSYEVNYLNPNVIKNKSILSLIIDNSSMYNTIFQITDIEIDYAEETITPIVSTPEIEGLIDVKPQTSLLKVQRVTYAKNIHIPFEYTEYVIKAEYYGTITYRKVK